MRRVLVVAVLLLAVACSRAQAGQALVVVNVPLQRDAFIATQITNGTRLAIEQINAAGGVNVNGARVHLAMRVMDSDLSPTRTTSNIRDAIARKAVAVIDEGTGIDAAWPTARDAGLPLAVTYQGAASLVDASVRPNVFRIAPTNRGIAFRLAEYVIPKGVRVALVTDDSPYGNGGRDALRASFARNPEAVAARIVVPAGSTDVGVQVLQARRARATALLLWMRPPLLAAVVRAVRSSGWEVPIYASIAAEDPLVRQQLADHPEWLDGLTFAMSRLTSEKGPGPFDAFRTAYEKRFGPIDVGVTSGGLGVVQVPDWAMYPYDFVHILVAALERSNATGPSPMLVRALAQVEVQGANGDERAFNERNHEGVVDDDIFFARFTRMRWEPVKDDPLSATLPALRQARS